MSSQDMQFADPEWQPPEEREENPVSQTQDPPRPINADRLDQPQWQTTTTPPQEGYLGPGYAGSGSDSQRSQPRTTWAAPSRPISQRRSSPWRWIILAFIILALMSGAFRGFGGYSGPSPQPIPKEQVQNFTVATNTAPTIVIQGDEGDINVSTSGSNSLVSIQESDPFSNAGDVNATQSGNTINVDDQGGPSGGADLDVVIPTNAILQITTTDGSIDVEGVNLTRSSTLSTGSGDITFNGSFSNGNYQFQSNDGDIDVTLQQTPNFSVNATTSSGSITTSDFPGIKNTGTQAQGSVGNASTAKQTTLTLTSRSGDITLSQSS
jgi:hypothetical protein